jgi:hypothetical protein
MKFIASFLLMVQVLGCSTVEDHVNAPVASEPSISVTGFVKTPGRFSYHDDMTLAEALAEAGGYRPCSSCRDFYEKEGWHPTFDWPPTLHRSGQSLQLPKTRNEWMPFKVQPHDEIKFRHIVF